MFFRNLGIMRSYVVLLAFLLQGGLRSSIACTSENQTVGSGFVIPGEILLLVQLDVQKLVPGERHSKSLSRVSDRGVLGWSAGRRERSHALVTSRSHKDKRQHQTALKRLGRGFHRERILQKPFRSLYIDRSDVEGGLRSTSAGFASGPEEGGEGGESKAGAEGGRKTDSESSELDEPDDEDEEEEREGNEDEDEEEEREENEVSVAIATTLLSAIVFQLCMTYLLNHKDEDIKQVSYELVSTTISIFCAVLVFQAFDRLVYLFIISRESSAMFLVVIDVAQLLFWHCTTELALAFTTGMIGSSLPEGIIGEVKCQTKCYAVLLAHITGFAAINAAGAVQQNFFNETPLTSVCAVLIAFFALRGLQRCSFELRAVTMSHIHEKDEEDHDEMDELKELWEEETEEAENDVLAFALSFTLIQTLRFAIGGTLPNQVGEEKPETLFYHDSLESLALLGFGPIFLVSTFCGNLFLIPLDWMFKRSTRVIVGSLEMSSAWCLFYGTQWLIGPYKPDAFERDYVLLALLTAMACSAFAFASIFIIDFICDFDRDSDGLKSLRKLMNVMGILVGFSWEGTFDLAEESISEATPYPNASAFILASVSVVVLIPAWRWYILPYVHQDGWKHGFIVGHTLMSYDNDHATMKRSLNDIIDKHKEEKTKKAEQIQRLSLSPHSRFKAKLNLLNLRAQSNSLNLKGPVDEGTSSAHF